MGTVMGDRPKRHHTVPQFYLRGFAAGERLEAVNVRTGAHHSTNVSDATVEANFYTVPDHSSDPSSFEAELSRIEDAVAPVYRSIVDGSWPLDPDHRALFAHYITLQFLRLPSHRTQMQNVLAADLRVLAYEDPKEFARIMDLPGAPRGVDFSVGDLPPLVSSAVHIEQIATLVPKLAGHVLGRPWELVRFDAPSLLTSDEPLTPLSNPREVQSVGLGLENSWALIFPLTRELALVMFRDPSGPLGDLVAADIALGRFDFARVGDNESSRLFNQNSVMHAYRFVYHHPDDGHLVPADVSELSKRGGRINFDDLPDGLYPSP